MKPVTYTSTLPDDLWDLLESYARKLKVPKNRLLENALRNYLGHLKKAEYIRSFKKAAGDEEMLSMAEEGMEDYLKMLGEE
jgi:predicted transcriptional regulator